MKFKKLGKNKKGIVTDYVGWILIGLLILVVIVVSIVILKDKGIAAWEYVKDLLRYKS